MHHLQGRPSRCRGHAAAALLGTTIGGNWHGRCAALQSQHGPKRAEQPACTQWVVVVVCMPPGHFHVRGWVGVVGAVGGGGWVPPRLTTCPLAFWLRA